MRVMACPVIINPMRSLKRTLDRFYKEFNFSERLLHDPIEFPRRYSDPEDIEAAGFIAACFAYGKVGLFRPVIGKVLGPAGKHPARFFRGFDPKTDAKYLRGAGYRFNREKDIVCFLYILGRALDGRGSLKNIFYDNYSPDDNDIGSALNGLIDIFLDIDTSPVYGRNIRPDGLKQLFPSPRKGSACKRMNLFLRWMVRNRDIDLGIWDRVQPSKLIIPLDTHIARIARCIGLTERSVADWKTAAEITGSLKRLDPDDPLKYDFALCHHGISGMCRGKGDKGVCGGCVFSNSAEARKR